MYGIANNSRPSPTTFEVQLCTILRMFLKFNIPATASAFCPWHGTLKNHRAQSMKLVGWARRVVLKYICGLQPTPMVRNRHSMKDSNLRSYSRRWEALNAKLITGQIIITFASQNVDSFRKIYQMCWKRSFPLRFLRNRLPMYILRRNRSTEVVIRSE